jgi:UDP-hydrolysing UDP-N-acetyl-D-glucosamine 2-epimerase
MRKICVVTGYRSDYTKLKSVIESIHVSPNLELQLLVFGAHLLEDYGTSISNIATSTAPISYRCNTNIEGDSPLAMVKTIGVSIIELSSAYNQLDPDIVILVGDRYEILAAAIAASIGNIPVAHIQGGEVSGTIDETIRHTVTKLSHIHFPSTELSKERILMMGEYPDHVFNVGCPAVDYIKNVEYVARDKINKLPGLSRLRIDFQKPYFVLIQHPVTTEYEQASKQMELTLEVLQDIGVQTVLIYPNPDAGSGEMVRAIRKHRRKHGKKGIVRNAYKNISFDSYLNLLKNSSCLVGNSSSGIREAHIFGIPVVNIGTRQASRERTDNIVDVDYEYDAIKDAISVSLHNNNCFRDSDIYGNGHASEQIADILADIDLTNIFQKMSFRKVENK